MNTTANYRTTTLPPLIGRRRAKRWLAQAVRVTKQVLIAPLRVIEGVGEGRGLVRLIGPGRRPQQRHEFEHQYVREVQRHGWQ